MEMELCYETIDHFRKRYTHKTKNLVPEEDCAKVMGKLLTVLQYMHNSKNIIHRDIKPMNVML